MEVSESTIQNDGKPKRKLEKTILDNFSKLTNPHENVRVKSAGNLLKYLVENSDNNEGLDELKYALKRLVRGLGAQTLAAKTGYYATLVALLSLPLNIDSSSVLGIVKTELHKSGKNSDGENADICAGRILACGAMIKARFWEKTELVYKNDILEILFTACKERTYLGLIGYSFIIELLNLVPDINKEKEFLLKIKEEVLKPWTEQSLDSLYLLLKLKLAYPKTFSKKCLKKYLQTPDIICEESLKSLCNILMAVPRMTSLRHPIFETIIALLSPTVLPMFFKELDTHLKTPNRNRLLVFIKILTNTLAYAEKSDNFFNLIPILFTRNFITQLLGYFRTFKGKVKDKEYQNALQKLFETLLELFNKEPVSSNVKISVIKKMLFDPGTFVFEKVTKSKIIQQITLSLDSQGVKKLALVYRGVADGSEEITSENDSETWLNNDRLYSAHLLIKLLSLPAMKQENDWKVDQLIFLSGISLLKEKSGMNVGRELAGSLKTAFFGALDLKLSKLEELHFILSRLVQSLDAKLNSENLDIILRIPLSQETYELWKKTLYIVKKIEKKHKKSGVSSLFLTLFLHMGLQLFNDVKLATDSLNELFSCYERVKKDKKIKHALENTTLNNTIVESEDDPLWIEVVIDLFLNLLSHNSHLLRSVINSVFPHLCRYMTSATIHQILIVLDPKDDENPLSNENESSTDSENDNDISEPEELDAENSTEDEAEDESSGDEGPSDDQTATEKLRIALHQALSNGTIESDDESIDLDQLSDTEGEKLDKALADAFRQFKPNHGRKKKQSKDQESLTHFRIRVLDLIEIYIESTPSMLLVLEIMLPLLQAVEFSIRDEYQKPLNDRLRSILKKLLGLKKFSDVEGVSDSILVELLKSLLDKGSKNVLIVQEMGEQISDCCIFIVKCSEIIRGIEGTPAKDKKKLKSRILEVINGELHQFFTKRDCLTPYVFFKNLMHLSWEGNIGLTIILLEYVFSSEVRQFKKNQVAELLKIFCSNQRFFKQYKIKLEDKMKEAYEEFGTKVLEFFKELCEQPERKDIKERFICNLFNLLSAMKHSSLEKSNIPWSDIAHNIREYRSYKSFSKDAKIAFNKLCSAIGVSNIVPMKQQVTKLASLIDTDEVGSVDEITEKAQKRKPKRKNKDTLKLKKEAKELRLNSLSRGLGHVGFEDSGILSGENIDMETKVEPSKFKNKKGQNIKYADNLELSPNTKKKKRKINEASEEIIEENGNSELTSNDSIHNNNAVRKKKNEEKITKQINTSSAENDIEILSNENKINKRKSMSEGAPLKKRKRKNSI